MLLQFDPSDRSEPFHNGAPSQAVPPRRLPTAPSDFAATRSDESNTDQNCADRSDENWHWYLIGSSERRWNLQPLHACVHEDGPSVSSNKIAQWCTVKCSDLGCTVKCSDSMTSRSNPLPRLIRPIRKLGLVVLFERKTL